MATTIFVIDDSSSMRESLNWLLTAQGFAAAMFSSAEDFLGAYDPVREGCILLDMRLPGMSGPELMAELKTRGSLLPVIVLTGHGDVPMAVDAMKRGAFHFLQKPFATQELLDAIQAALTLSQEGRSRLEDRMKLREALETLTPREMDVMQFVVEGESSKTIGKRLGISNKTVDIHRANILRKLKAKNIAELIRAWMTLNMPPA